MSHVRETCWCCQCRGRTDQKHTASVRLLRCCTDECSSSNVSLNQIFFSLYGNWLRPRCRITTRFLCCALALKSPKTDIAAVAWLSLKSAVFVETERLLCWHLWWSSTARSDSCRKTDIYVATLEFFRTEMTLRGLSPLNASQLYNETMLLTASRSVAIHVNSCRTCLDKCDTWQAKAPDVSEVADEGIFSIRDSRHLTHDRITVIGLFIYELDTERALSLHWTSTASISSHIMSKVSTSVMISVFDQLWLYSVISNSPSMQSFTFHPLL